MPVTFSQIAANVAEVTIQTAVGLVTIKYYPNKLTEKVVAELQATTLSANDLLTELIKSWDIYEDEAFTVMFPLSRIDDFGVQFKQSILEAIARDIRPEVVTAQMNGSGSI